MAGKDRKRQIARQRYERKMAARAAARAKARQRWAIGGSAGAVVAVVAIVLALTLPNNGKSAASGSSPAASSSASASAAASASPVAQGPKTAPGCTYTIAKPASAPASALPSGAAADLKTQPTGITIPGGAVPTTIEVKDLVTGTGKAATPSDTVNVNYTGFNYVDCKEFDSSWSRGSAASFSLDGVIPGFKFGIGGGNGIAPMKIGGRREIIVPPGQGYGAKGGGSVGPNEELVFVVDLLGTTPPAASNSGPTGPVS